MTAPLPPHSKVSDPGPQQALQDLAEALGPENFGSSLDAQAEALLRRGLHAAGADEGTLWLPDRSGEFLVPVWNSGPNAGRIVGQFRQPVGAGLICMVFATEQPFVENDIVHNSQQSKLLDVTLGVRTQALAAVPLQFVNACRGVLSAVQLGDSDVEVIPPRTFAPAALAELQLSAGLLGRLIEHQLMARVLGLVES